VVRDAASQVTRRAAEPLLWSNSTLLEGDAMQAVAKLKQLSSKTRPDRPPPPPALRSPGWSSSTPAGCPPTSTTPAPWTSGPGGPVSATAPFTWMVELGSTGRVRMRKDGPMRVGSKFQV
jgi:hypothetical protein